MEKRKVGVGLLAGASLVASGRLLQLIGEQRDKRAHPPPGDLVDIGGRRLHYLLEGTHNDGPTVVFDTGLGGNLLSWDLFTPSVTAFARTLRFDRPGLGWSEPSREPRSAATVARDLCQLLEHARIPGPYVLVGWSIGALHMRVFATIYAEEVAGLVLVDPSHEDMLDELRQETPQGKGIERSALRAIELVSWIGVARSLGPRFVVKLTNQRISTNDFPRSSRLASLATYRQAHVLRSIIAETRALPASLDEVRRVRAALPFPNVPMFVITRDEPFPTPAMTTSWQQLHADLVGLSCAGRQIIAGRSGHLVPVDRPDVVIEAIREVITVAPQTGVHRTNP